MDKHQAAAIYRMAPNRHEYNLAIMTMLGRHLEAIEHSGLCIAIERITAERDQLAATVNTLTLYEGFDALMEAVPVEVAAAQTMIDELLSEKARAWAPMQALIDEARTIAEADNAEWLP